MESETTPRMSLARKILLDMDKQKGIRSFLNTSGIFDEHSVLSEETIRKKIYTVLKGKSSVNIKWIFTLRNSIPPLYWYTDSEADPGALDTTKFTSRHKTLDLSVPTLGVQKLLSIKNKGYIQALAKEAGLEPYSILTLYTKNKTGNFIKKPTENDVLRMAPYIKADWWYIYPDEVDEETRSEAAIGSLPTDKDGKLVKVYNACSAETIIQKNPVKNVDEAAEQRQRLIKFSEFLSFLEKNIEFIPVKSKERLIALLMKDKYLKD